MVTLKAFLKDRKLTREFKSSGLSKTRFLKEKRLTYAYRKDRSIKRKSRFTSVVNGEITNFISYRQKAKIISYKRKNKTITYKRKARTVIVDRFSLRNVFTSKLSIRETENKARDREKFSEKASFRFRDKVTKDVIGKQEDVTFSKSVLSRKFVRRKLVGKNTQILESRSSVLVGKEGKVFIKAEFKFQDGTKAVGEGQSAKSVDLSIADKRESAINDALKRAIANTHNSGVISIRVISLHYEYRLSAFR